MSPFPWPNPLDATAPPLRGGGGKNFLGCDKAKLRTVSRSYGCILTRVPAVCTPRLHSGRSSPSRKYFPSRHGDTPRLDPPFCCRRPRDAPGGLTGEEHTRPSFIFTYSLRSTRTARDTSTGGVKCHLVPLLFSLYSHSNGLCVDRRPSKHLFILPAVNMWHLNPLD